MKNLFSTGSATNVPKSLRVMGVTAQQSAKADDEVHEPTYHYLISQRSWRRLFVSWRNSGVRARARYVDTRNAPAHIGSLR